MQLLKLKTQLHQFETFAEFAKEFGLNKKDLVLTNSFLYEPFMKDLGLDCHFVMQEKYGLGEPSDEMMNAILNDTKSIDYNRIIAVGGGTVIDISKLFVLKGITNVGDAFERKMPLEKAKKLVILPTTCGTGSEVTNISIAEIKAKHTKMGLADDTLLADDAVFVPELLKGLPFRFYAASAIDALIHATEAYLSPKANAYTKLFSIAATQIIIDVFKNIVAKGEEYRFDCFSEMLIASNYAGIAFGNAGVGAVHALSYPLGGAYHVPHGEANYQFFTEIFKLYQSKAPQGAIASLNNILSEILETSSDKVYDKLEELLSNVLIKKPLKEFGMKEEEVSLFAQSVIKTQQRLLANNYVELSESEIKDVYQRLF